MMIIDLKVANFNHLKTICTEEHIVFKEVLSMDELQKKTYFKEFIGEVERFENDDSLHGNGFGEYSGEEQYFITDLNFIGLADQRDCGIDIIFIFDIKIEKE
ncbi:hypothetical protein O8C86_09300 [Aliarcobacter butzleri]|uniref:hypothetical protein n=1 Tax=Aliarcobacter butzleri TaxID=28197 RepID=UPI00263C1453|nr:hypothetical protein [Aliarcobacter butzleri]MDN5062030.1 hypothetical protein [Aliarcobacter butzleri]